jgi:drug/metabolite transporter (DMT)-like permease
MKNNVIQGIKFALLTALISGLANFLNKEIIIAGVNPVALTALKNGFVGLVFAAITLPLLKSQKLQKRDWLKFITIAIIGGSIPFILFFKGLALSTAIKSSFIHKTMFIWVALWSFIFLKEKFSRYQFAALVILAVSILAAINFNFFTWGKGEAMILIATLFWSIEIMLVKKFLKNIDFRLLAVARMALGALIIFGYGIYTNELTQIYSLTAISWLKILIVSGFLFGYVFTWYRALSLAPATLVSNILTLAFPITILAANLKSFSLPRQPDIIASLLIFGGVTLFLNAFIVKWQAKQKLSTE